MNKKQNNNNHQNSEYFNKKIFDRICVLLDSDLSQNMENIKKLSDDIDDQMAKEADYFLLRKSIQLKNEFMVDKILEKIDMIEDTIFDSPIQIATENSSPNIFKKVLKKSIPEAILPAFLYSLLMDKNSYLDDFINNINFKDEKIMKHVNDFISFHGQNNTTNYFYSKLNSIEDKKILKETIAQKSKKAGFKKM